MSQGDIMRLPSGSGRGTCREAGALASDLVFVAGRVPSSSTTPAIRQAVIPNSLSHGGPPRMAIFHLTTKPISRGKGQSAIAAAAYRSGEKLRDEQTGEQKFYQARADRIQFTAIMAPKDAPEWAHDRNALWNAAERAEGRKDARLAREIEVSLPHELTAQQREWLVKDFAREAFVRRGYVVDIAIHAPDRDGDNRNHHAHLMITERTIGPDGFAKGKDPTMNKTEQLDAWRAQWAHLTNRHLERHGHEARVDHRSLEAQGLEREATTHVGYAGNEIAARGGQSDRMDALRGIVERNDIRLEIKAVDRDLAALAREEEEARRQRAPASGGFDWTDRGGMVAQQGSALNAARQAQRRDTGLMGDFVTQAQKDQAAAETARRDKDPDKFRDFGQER